MAHAHSNVNGRIKATYNKNAAETTDELVQLLSNIDLLVLDDIGVETQNIHSISYLAL